MNFADTPLLPPLFFPLQQSKTLPGLLFAAAPALDGAGHLSFAPASGSTGRAVFRVNQHQSITGGTAASLEKSKLLVVRVVAANRPPSFRLVSSDFVITESDGTTSQVREGGRDHGRVANVLHKGNTYHKFLSLLVTKLSSGF